MERWQSGRMHSLGNRADPLKVSGVRISPSPKFQTFCSLRGSGPIRENRRSRVWVIVTMGQRPILDFALVLPDDSIAAPAIAAATEAPAIPATVALPGGDSLGFAALF